MPLVTIPISSVGIITIVYHHNFLHIKIIAAYINKICEKISSIKTIITMFLTINFMFGIEQN